jgi:undecaprenyl-diphosphatase
MRDLKIAAIIRSPAGRAIVTALVLVLAFALDPFFREALLKIQIPAVSILMGWLALLGATPLLLSVTGVLLIYGIWRDEPALKVVGFLGLTTLFFSRIVADLLKHLIGRPRPSVLDQDGFQLGPSFMKGYDSFPSGHAVTIFAMAAVLSYVYPQWKRGWYAAAAMVGLTRVYLDFHFVSDVVAGAILGMLTAKGVVFLYERYRIA